MALVDSDSHWVSGCFEENKIPAVRLGNQVKIYMMSGGPPLRGHVESISRGITDRDNPTGPELLANVNPTFEWARLAQRIPVLIHIDEIPDGILISSGMTCTVVVQTPPPLQPVRPQVGKERRKKEMLNLPGRNPLIPFLGALVLGGMASLLLFRQHPVRRTICPRCPSGRVDTRFLRTGIVPYQPMQWTISSLQRQSGRSHD